MAVQKSRKTRSTRGMRRSQDRVRIPELSQDSTTGETHIRHHMTESGFYRGKQIKVMKQKNSKEESTESVE